MEGIAILGASGGLGVAVTQRVGRHTPVTLGYHQNKDKAEALATTVTDGGGKARVASVDMRDESSVRDFLDQATSHWGQLSAIVQVTGPAIPLCPMERVSGEEFKRILETDVIGSFNVLKSGVATLKRSGGGSIVLFLTTAVLRTLEHDGMSGIPKTAVSGLLKQTAREAGPSNVRINGVAPGVIDAGIVHSSFVVDQTAKDVIADCLAKTPMKRMGKPEEVAALVEFLISKDAGYINGQVIAIDGGYSA